MKGVTTTNEYISIDRDRLSEAYDYLLCINLEDMIDKQFTRLLNAWRELVDLAEEISGRDQRRVK